MKIHEYQGKAILKEFGVPVPAGDVADTPAQARRIAERLAGRVVVKAQVHAGGRGKAGGVKLADDPAGAEAAATQILGMMLKTPQTPPEGIKVLKVLVEEARPIATELYLSMTLDRGRGTHVVMASQAGGMEIEEVAATHPEKIIREWTDPALGLQPFQARNLAFGLGLKLPVVLRAEGTNVEQGKKMLAESGLSLVMADDMGEGAKKVVALARGAQA